MAALSNIETKQVYRAINGEHSISLSMLAAIPKGLEVHPKKLLVFNLYFSDDEKLVISKTSRQKSRT